MAEPAYDFHHDPDPWPEQGSWTWDDYLRLPEDGQRYEIIHGVLYVSPAPRYVHQLAVARLVHFLSVFVLGRDLGVVLTAPFDVLLPGVAEPVEPDVLFLKSGNLPDPAAKNFVGIPDLVVEVLSPSTRRVDLKVKRLAYQEAGVTEYWIVDPKLQTVTVYHLDETRHEYRELGCFQADETVRSKLLEAFEMDVADLFP